MRDAPGPWILVPLRPSEVVDRRGIDGLKAERLAEAAARDRAAERCRWFDERLADLQPWPEAVVPLAAELDAVNATLWELEGAQRAALARGALDVAFAETARRIYVLNDRRAALKRALDLAFGAAPGDDKSHPTPGVAPDLARENP